MEDTQGAEGTVRRNPVYGELEFPADVLEKCWIRSSADGGKVEFHFDPPDTIQITRIDVPLGTFAIALKEIAATGNANHLSKSI